MDVEQLRDELAKPITRDGRGGTGTVRGMVEYIESYLVNMHARKDMSSDGLHLGLPDILRRVFGGTGRHQGMGVGSIEQDKHR